MEIVINPEIDTPIFEQLITQIKKAMSKGKLLPGATLPSIRQLANDLDINNKTVAKAYRLLERDNVIQTRGYRGTIVHPDAAKNCLLDMKQVVRTELSLVVENLKQRGATDSEIRIAFADILTNR